MSEQPDVKNITVLYADFMGFTKLAKIFQPDDMMAFLNRLFAVMEAPINESGGVIDKIIGDAILVTFNAFQSLEKHQERAVKAALEIIKAVHVFSREEELDINLGLGISSGAACCGPLGTKKFHPATVIGPVVARAFKLSERACREKETTLLVDDTIFHETISIFEYQQIEENIFKVQIPIVQ